MKQQVIFLNGAVPKENRDSYYDFLQDQEYNPYEEVFYNWNKTLWERLWENFEYLRAPYGNIKFADYEAWKIMFEKMLSYFRDDCVFVSTSLGSTFILKYMIETGFPKSQKLPISKFFFLAAALHDTQHELLGTFSFDVQSISKLWYIANQVYIYHSSDDDLVPMSDSEELFEYFPDATFREFTDKGHFYKETRLPEIEEDIKRP